MKIDRAKLDDCVAKMDAVVARTDPPVSEKQRRAMHAAASGNSALGIPKKVGQEFAEADPGGKLPKSKSDGGPGSGPQKGSLGTVTTKVHPSGRRYKETLLEGLPEGAGKPPEPKFRTAQERRNFERLRDLEDE